MTDIDRTRPVTDLINLGRQALDDGAWEDGRRFFQLVVDTDASAEALEGLAMAAWWLDDAPVIFDARERAYRLYRQQRDSLSAGRMATWLALDHYIYRGDLAITNGWLQRARRLLDGLEQTAEFGWLALWQAHIALFERNDVVAAQRAAAETVALARSLEYVDLEMLALALQGLTLVSEGRIADGMRLLDESTTAALAGEMTDLDAIVTTCCYLIFACERVHDYDRAAQWCRQAQQVAVKRSYRSMFSFCRTHYAAVLIWRGEWEQAERELLAATHELMATRTGWAGEGIARLGELRRLQGRLDEAAALFDRVPAHPLALRGKAEIALDRGDLATASELVDRFFRRVPSEDVTERAAGLELAVRIQVAAGAIDRARDALTELQATANLVGTDPLRGLAAMAQGFVSLAECDDASARRAFEDAVDLFQHDGAPFQAARARCALASALAATGRTDAALRDAQAALETFRTLGADHEAGRAVALLRQLGHEQLAALDAAANPDGLTRREREVLTLVARGLSNQQIAEQLFLSVRTVERHIST
ncbi:MAG: LuxR C-terminal-related transcriptional regulator, partial [Vicinamibacterales bacterium]